MPLIKWSKQYSVGVKAMDSQHIALAGVLNELHSAMLKGQAQSVASGMVEKLLHYVRDHFSAEEAMLESARFPGLAEHRGQHRHLTGKVEEYASRFQQGDQTMYPELLHFVRDWLVHHIQGEDKQYTTWINERGIH